jgi:hypothetical protein
MAVSAYSSTCRSRKLAKTSHDSRERHGAADARCRLLTFEDAMEESCALGEPSFPLSWRSAWLDQFWQAQRYLWWPRRPPQPQRLPTFCITGELTCFTTVGLLRIPRAQQAERVITFSHGKSASRPRQRAGGAIDSGPVKTSGAFFTLVPLGICLHNSLNAANRTGKHYQDRQTVGYQLSLLNRPRHHGPRKLQGRRWQRTAAWRLPADWHPPSLTFLVANLAGR